MVAHSVASERLKAVISTIIPGGETLNVTVVHDEFEPDPFSSALAWKCAVAPNTRPVDTVEAPSLSHLNLERFGVSREMYEEREFRLVLRVEVIERIEKGDLKPLTDAMWTERKAGGLDYLVHGLSITSERRRTSGPCSRGVPRRNTAIWNSPVGAL